MNRVTKILLCVLVLVAFFFGSYFATMKLVVEPRYNYLTEAGVADQIAALEAEISSLHQQIAELEGGGIVEGDAPTEDGADAAVTNGDVITPSLS